MTERQGDIVWGCAWLLIGACLGIDPLLLLPLGIAALIGAPWRP